MKSQIGRLCVKLAGRDAGKECLIIKSLDKNLVMIDGLTRRRKCNIGHLEFLDKVAEIKENASHEEVLKALEAIGIKEEKKERTRPKKTEAEKAKVKPLTKGLAKQKKADEKPKAEKKKEEAKKPKKKAPKKE